MSLIPNKHEYRPILTKGKDFNVSRSVLVHKSQLKNWQALEKDRNKNFYCVNLYRYIYQLGGIADQRGGLEHTLIRKGVDIGYIFDEQGDVYIQGLDFTVERAPTRQSADVYPVVCNYDEDNRKHTWDTDNNAAQS